MLFKFKNKTENRGKRGVKREHCSELLWEKTHENNSTLGKLLGEACP